MALFYMWDRFRRQQIANHKFYVKEAKRRLLSQFDDIEAEADKFGESKLKEYAAHYNPDTDNGDALQEAAYEEMCNHYQMLDEMRNRTRLSVAAGMFHEWDKQLREWVAKEAIQWGGRESTEQAIWKVNFPDIIDLFKSLDWDIAAKPYYISLNRCRLVVNAYKHGEGNALLELKQNYPEFLKRTGLDIAYVDYTDLNIGDNHIEEFSSSIVEFWQDIPEYIYEKAHMMLPGWFEKAFKKDQAARTKKATP